jgi:hypothetical protein
MFVSWLFGIIASAKGHARLGEGEKNGFVRGPSASAQKYSKITEVSCALDARGKDGKMGCGQGGQS